MTMMMRGGAQVPDEEEIRYKTQQIAIEYEKKMQKMTAELAEARASSERTAAEMDRLKAEAEAKQRQLYADVTLQAQSERVQLKQQFDAEMDRVQRELESARRGKDLVQSEMDSLRRQYETAMFSVENSVPPQQLAAERERLRAEYESNMKVMRDELEAVKMSRSSVEADMEDLKAQYAARLSAGQSAMIVANASTSTALLSINSERKLRQQNLTDEMKIVSVDSLKLQTDKRGNITSDNSVKADVDQRQSGSDVISSVQTKLVKDSLSKYSVSDRTVVPQETKVDNNVPEPLSIDTEQLHRDVSSHHETAVFRMKTELEDFKRSRDDIAKVIHGIKTEYQEAVWRAVETVPRHSFDERKQEIRVIYERQMDRVKDDLHVLKSLRDIVNVHMIEHTSAWKNYEEERRKIQEDVEAGRVERRIAPGLTNEAAQRYFEETRRLSGVAATDKENMQAKVISERFDREKQRIRDDVEAGKLTETETDNLMDQTIKAKTAELTAVREQANNCAPSVVEDLDQEPETNVNRKSSTSKSLSKTGVQSSGRGAEVGDAAARRLKDLEDILIHGGRDVTGGGSSPDTEHCRFIREKLRREKLNAEEKQRRLQEAHKSTKPNYQAYMASVLHDVFTSKQDEIVAMTTALEQLRSQNENLYREISDIQAVFKFNPLMDTGNYSAVSNNMKLVHWPLMGGLLHLVQ